MAEVRTRGQQAVQMLRRGGGGVGVKGRGLRGKGRRAVALAHLSALTRCAEGGAHMSCANVPILRAGLAAGGGGAMVQLGPAEEE